MNIITKTVKTLPNGDTEVFSFITTDVVPSVESTLGDWLSAALEDPNSAPEFKACIEKWFEQEEKVRAAFVIAFDALERSTARLAFCAKEVRELRNSLSWQADNQCARVIEVLDIGRLDLEPALRAVKERLA